jgi:Undecaprenyl-phosphate galactose phosphotransferase WbaP
VTETHSREYFDEIPVVRGFHNLQSVSKSTGITHALVAMSSENALPISEIVRVYGRYFPKLSIIPDLLGPANLCLDARAVGNILTLGVRQNLLLTGPKIYKRTIDVLAALIIGVLLSPILVIIALAIKLSSRGPILYGQKRVGKDGINFWALKFRTMVIDADAILDLHLQNDAALRYEWERDHKLKEDPRATLLGKFLRRYSLDELPQIWNVIVGEMSMIGPRPIVKDEIRRYGDNYDVYSRVLPGITGLWQVSGRNDTTYRERVELDCYYVYNWSPWLDLHILTRTFTAVMGRRGAY